MTGPDRATAVTRIARRKVIPGHERDYEQLVREMFALMKQHRGFPGAELIPPENRGGAYHSVVT